jgi:hypothetical protein
MARLRKIPVGDVIEGAGPGPEVEPRAGIPQPQVVEGAPPIPEPASRAKLRLPEVTEWSPTPEPSTTPSNGRFGAPANPEPGWEAAKPAATATPEPMAGPRAQPGGFAPEGVPPAAAAEPKVGMARRVADGLRNSGSAARTATTATGELLKDAGATARAALPTASTALRAGGGAALVGMQVAPHAGVYTGEGDMSFGDRARVVAGDALTLGGGAVGGAAGAALGSGFAPGVGTVAGGFAGGAAGAAGGHALAEKLFGVKDALRRGGFDPERGVTDLFDGKGVGPTLPQTSTGNFDSFRPPKEVLPATGFGSARGSVNPPMAADVSMPLPKKYVAPEGTITRDGNSYSGTNIKVDAPMVGPSGGALRNGGNVTVLPSGSEGYRQDLATLARNAAERANAPEPGGAIGIGSGYDASIAAKNAATEASSITNPINALGRSMSGADRRLAAQLATETGIAGRREAGETQRTGMSVGAQQVANSNALRIASMHDATQRRGNDQTTQVAMAGHEMALRGHMAPLELAQWRRNQAGSVYRAVGAGGQDGTLPITPEQHTQAAAHFLAMGMPEEAKAAQEAASSANTLDDKQGESSRKAFDGLIMGVDKDGKRVVDHDASAHVAALTNRYAPGFAHMSGPQRQQVVSHMAALGQMMNDGLGQDTKVGWRGLNPFSQAAPGDVEPPNIQGAKIERLGNVEGKVTIGASAGEHLITTKDGKQYRLPNLDSRQRAILEQAIKSGSWAPPNQLRPQE